MDVGKIPFVLRLKLSQLSPEQLKKEVDKVEAKINKLKEEGKNNDEMLAEIGDIDVLAATILIDNGVEGVRMPTPQDTKAKEVDAALKKVADVQVPEGERVQSHQMLDGLFTPEELEAQQKKEEERRAMQEKIAALQGRTLAPNKVPDILEEVPLTRAEIKEQKRQEKLAAKAAAKQGGMHAAMQPQPRVIPGAEVTYERQEPTPPPIQPRRGNVGEVAGLRNSKIASGGSIVLQFNTEDKTSIVKAALAWLLIGSWSAPIFLILEVIAILSPLLIIYSLIFTSFSHSVASVDYLNIQLFALAISVFGSTALIFIAQPFNKALELVLHLTNHGAGTDLSMKHRGNPYTFVMHHPTFFKILMIIAGISIFAWSVITGAVYEGDYGRFFKLETWL